MDFWVAPVLLIELWLFCGVVLAFHRASTRFGLTPLVVLLGAAVVISQVSPMGESAIQVGGHEIHFSLVSLTTLPAILLGILVIYVSNGTSQARAVGVGAIGITFLSLVYHLLPPARGSFIGLEIVAPAGRPTGMLDWSIPPLALMVEIILVTVVYQAVANWRRRFPSQMAAFWALLAALSFDALVSALLEGLSSPASALVLASIKLLSTVALMPLAMLYLRRVAPRLPDSAARSPRPVLDIFTTVAQIEARARYHYSLLRTLSQINQLIVRASSPASLLEQACQQLLAQRDYDLAWIGLGEPGTDKVRPVAQVCRPGFKMDDLQALFAELPAGQDPILLTHQSGKAILVQPASRATAPLWWETLKRRAGGQSCALLPLRQKERVLGVMVILADRPDAFGSDESELLQELADDLAYALVNLEARRTQVVLQTAAESMQSGLIVGGLDGKITYANPAAARILGRPAGDLIGRDGRELLLPGEAQKVFETYLGALLGRGIVEAEFELPSAGSRGAFVAVTAVLVRDEASTPLHIIVNLNDISQRRLYEDHLLTINRLITELVQIHDIKQLLETLLKESELLLQADASGIYIVDAQERGPIDAITHNMPADYGRNIISDYHGLPGEDALLHLQPVAVDDIATDPTYKERLKFLAQYGMRSLLAVPISFQNRLLGALVVYRHTVKPFDENEIQVGVFLAHTLAIAIQNARLYEGEHVNRELAEALAQAAASLNSSLNLDNVLDKILEQTLRVVSCRSANIMLVEGDTARVARRRGEGDPGLPYDGDGFDCLSLDTPTLQNMLMHAEPILVGDTAKDPYWQSLPSTEWIASYAAAPLVVEEEIVGFLNVNSDQPDFFNEATVIRLQAFATHAAIAIRNARLYQEMQEYAAHLQERVRERTAELQSAKDRIEVILSSVPDAVFVLDDQHHLIEANQAGLILLSQARQDNLNLFADRLLHQSILHSVPSEEAVIEVQQRAYQALASPLPISEDRQGLVIVFRDVTRFRELDQMKTRFVSDVSHELRTPLTNLTIYLDLLVAIQEPAKRQHYIETLQRETGRLTHLIEDLLTISRLEAGRIQITLKPLDANRLVDELANDRTIMASNQGITLLHETSPELPMALADRLMLNQCLSNLLTNAIHYTPPGGVVRLFTSLERDDQGSWVVVHVADNGVGILPEELPRIFERFYRGSASRQTNAPGTGLGLSISKEIVARMGGHIHVQSSPGKGSEFSVWLRVMAGE